MAITVNLRTKRRITHIDPRTIGIRTLRVIQDYEKRILDNYQSIFETWNEVDIPAITVERGYKGADFRLSIILIGQIYLYVTGGTSVRYATMSHDFKPKSVHHYIGAYPGAGDVSYISKRVARPGIEARDFEFAIRKLHEKSFKRDITDAIRRGIAAGKRR